MTLPTDRDARNALPIWDGALAYFPDVWAEVAKVSVLGNKQHNLGSKLFWNTAVSTDHANKVIRHMLDDAAGNIMDDDGQTMHLAKALWRVAAMLQLRCWERDGKDEHGRPMGAKNYGTVAYPCSVPPPSSPDTRRTEGRQRNVLWDDEITPPIRPSSSDATPQPLLCLCGYTVCKKCQHPS